MLANVSAVMTASHAGESLDCLNQPVQPVLCQGFSPVHSNTPPNHEKKERHSNATNILRCLLDSQLIRYISYSGLKKIRHEFASMSHEQNIHTKFQIFRTLKGYELMFVFYVFHFSNINFL